MINLSSNKSVKKKKILHIITGLGDGGAEGVLFRLCKNSKNFEHEVISLTGDGKYANLLRDIGVFVHDFNFSGLLSFFKLVSLIRQSQPYLVQTWMYHSDLLGGVAARFAGVKNVFWGVRHSNLEKGKVKFSTVCVAKILSILSYFIPKKIICCANRAKAVHIEIGYAKERMCVIQNGYDLSDFYRNENSRQKIRNEWQATKDTFVIGNVARYDPFKDHKNLLFALSKLKLAGVSFKAFLIGNGVTNQNLDLIKIINDSNLVDYVFLLGPRRDIPAVMNALDIHVLSSSSEGFPNVVAESMACGIFNVCTRVGDVEEVMPNPKFICPPNDSQSLFQAILESYVIWSESPDFFEINKKENELVIRNKFSIEVMVSSFESEWLLV